MVRVEVDLSTLQATAGLVVGTVELSCPTPAEARRVAAKLMAAADWAELPQEAT